MQELHGKPMRRGVRIKSNRDSRSKYHRNQPDLVPSIEFPLVAVLRKMF
jgi:hypothetical protein